MWAVLRFFREARVVVSNPRPNTFAQRGIPVVSLQTLMIGAAITPTSLLQKSSRTGAMDVAKLGSAG